MLQNSVDPAVSTPAERSQQSSSGNGTGNSALSAGGSNEPPKKIPRLERLLDASKHSNNASPQSPRSPRNLPKKNVLDRTNSSGNFQPPSNRRFSSDSAAVEQETSSSSRGTKKRIKNDSDEEDEDSSSAFYLKHQNRALATELKSLQFAVKQLEDERDARRKHCREALHAVHELRNTWTSLEEETVGDIISPSSAAAGAEISSEDDPASTGSGDSVEWTRALQKSLIELGQGSSSEKSSISSTNSLKDATANIAARAKVLQEWIGTLLKSAGSALPRKNDSDETHDAEQRLHNLQHEMGVVTARCTELEAQVSELAAVRKDIAARERRIRRNVYRMAAGIMTSDQVVNTLERGEGDELEAEVQLEKQSVKTEPPPAESSSAPNQEQMDTVSSALLDEHKAKIAALEETASNAEKSIQDVRTLVVAARFFRFVFRSVSSDYLCYSFFD